MKTDLQQKIKWDIQTEAVTINGCFPTGKTAIVRNDNGRVLGIVGKDYCPVSNTRLMQFTDALTKTGEFELKGFDEINDGKMILAYLQNKNPNLSISGCAMREYLVIGNSHDGTKPFYIGTGSSLIRCENQFYSTLKVFRKKHTSPILIEEGMIQDLIKTYKAKKTNIYSAFDGMESVRVNDQVVERLIREIHKMLATDSREIKAEELGWSPSMITLRNSIKREMRDLGNNAFGLFNGVTWYTSHEMRNAGADFGKQDSTANLINQKAYRFCNQLKRVSTELHILS
jgi:hypothetical protein